MSGNSKFLQLNEADNCLIVRAKINPGEKLRIGDQTVIAREAVEPGFKVAARDIAPAEKILKWGVSIGSATEKIPLGEVIHTHNMKSDYIPTLLRDKQDSYFQTAKH